MVTIDNRGDKQGESQWPEGLHKLFFGTSNLLEQKDQESYITPQQKHQIMQILRRSLPVCLRCSFHCLGQLWRAGQCTKRTAKKGRILKIEKNRRRAVSLMIIHLFECPIGFQLWHCRYRTVALSVDDFDDLSQTLITIKVRQLSALEYKSYQNVLLIAQEGL